MTGTGGAPGWPAAGGRTGSVVDFDEEVGLGAVAGAGGGRWQFHCTQITDGTRTIEVGTAVSFEVVAGRRGAWEAAAVRPLAG